MKGGRSKRCAIKVRLSNRASVFGAIVRHGLSKTSDFQARRAEKVAIPGVKSNEIAFQGRDFPLLFKGRCSHLFGMVVRLWFLRTLLASTVHHSPL